ncbi:hypothetical protein KPA94_23095 [Burkholderia semiarida]|nr:hypothetical protein [Burkholderia semiarida]
MLSFFIERTDMKDLMQDELEFLAAAGEEAAGAAATLSNIVSGIGCLIGEDQASTGGMCGALQESDTPQLLWFIAAQIETIGKMALIGSRADDQLRVRTQKVSVAATQEGNRKSALQQNN